MVPARGPHPPTDAGQVPEHREVHAPARRRDFPDPRTTAPPNPFASGVRELSDIEGVILLFPSTINQQSPAFTHAAATCAFPLHNH